MKLDSLSAGRQVIFTIATVLGGVACLSSLLLLWACFDSRHPGSLFKRMHLPPIPYGKIITMIYLKVRSSCFTCTLQRATRPIRSPNVSCMRTHAFLAPFGPDLHICCATAATSKQALSHSQYPNHKLWPSVFHRENILFSSTCITMCAGVDQRLPDAVQQPHDRLFLDEPALAAAGGRGAVLAGAVHAARVRVARDHDGGQRARARPDARRVQAVAALGLDLLPGLVRARPLLSASSRTHLAGLLGSSSFWWNVLWRIISILSQCTCQNAGVGLQCGPGRPSCCPFDSCRHLMVTGSC